MRHITRICAALLVVLIALPADAQHLTLDTEGMQDELIGMYLPKIAVADDGSYGVAVEGLFRTSTGREVLRVLAQRYSAAGAAIGPTHVFEGESCSALDIWLFDYMERPEIAFHPSGVMLVLMQHSGELQIGTDGVQSAELTLGGIDVNGELLDLAPQYESCLQAQLIFVGGGRQDRPRFDLTPNGEIFLTADGFFGDASFRAVAIRVLDAEGNEAIDEVIPHVDTESQESFHMYPDIATDSNIMLSAWHRCPIVDAQGNADECDVEVQFGTLTPQGLEALEGNQRVNSGDPVGTLNVYPAAAINGTGASVVAWADGRDGPHGEIYAQRFDANAQPVGGNFKVSAGEGTLDWRPEVAILENGRFMIAWTDTTAAGYHARARTYDAAGNPEGAPEDLAPGAQSGDVSVAADGTTFAHVVLTRQGDDLGLGSNKAVTFTASEEPVDAAAGVFAASAYPNPFVDHARITYELDVAGPVTIRAFDLLGREVQQLVEDVAAPGTHHVTLDGSALAPGLYLLEMRSADARRTISLMRTQ